VSSARENETQLMGKFYFGLPDDALDGFQPSLQSIDLKMTGKTWTEDDQTLANYTKYHAYFVPQKLRATSVVSKLRAGSLPFRVRVDVAGGLEAWVIARASTRANLDALCARLSHEIDSIENFAPSRKNWEMLLQRLLRSADDEPVGQVIVDAQRVLCRGAGSVWYLDASELANVKRDIDRMTQLMQEREAVITSMRNELKALDTQTEENRERIDDLGRRVVQIERYQAAQASQQNAMKELATMPNRLLYYRTLVILLESMFLSCKSLAGGFVAQVSSVFLLWRRQGCSVRTVGRIGDGVVGSASWCNGVTHLRSSVVVGTVWRVVARWCKPGCKCRRETRRGAQTGSRNASCQQSHIG
jgi:hypothetical protein